jgi:predicted nucleotidyltransferase
MQTSFSRTWFVTLIVCVLILMHCLISAAETPSKNDSKQADKIIKIIKMGNYELPETIVQILNREHPGWKINAAVPVQISKDGKAQCGSVAKGDFDKDSWDDYALEIYLIDPNTDSLYQEKIVFLFRDNSWKEFVLDTQQRSEEDFRKYVSKSLENWDIDSVMKALKAENNYLLCVEKKFRNCYGIPNDQNLYSGYPESFKYQYLYSQDTFVSYYIGGD